MRPVTVAVIGGGIAGLAAALRLRDRLGPAAQITVYEQGRQVGGKLRGAADAFLLYDGPTDSAAAVLARRLGLPLVHPQPVPAALVLDGELRQIPAGTLVGVPGDLSALAGIAEVTDRDRDEGRPVLAPDQDVAVGELVRARLGDQVTERLVDPMLGGVYAGRADTLSLAVTIPALAAACRTEPTLVGAVRAALAQRRRAAGPVFGSVAGGLAEFAEAVAAASKATIRLGLPVRELRADGGGWRLVVGATRDPVVAHADAVVLALPARPAARLLAPVAPEPAALIGELDYASVALVRLALPAGTPLPELSGFLVPASEPTVIKAATFMSRKWAHVPGVVIRASVGRYGDPGPLRLADPELLRRVRADLARILGELPEPVEASVHRWGGALPQYAPGHLDRVAAARAGLPGTLRLAGAGFDGVGIPACVKSGEAAADGVAEALGESVT
ncbi:MAG TPA: protoporphyrinogen oxidase [Natronosporangium sp.]